MALCPGLVAGLRLPGGWQRSGRGGAEPLSGFSRAAADPATLRPADLGRRAGQGAALVRSVAPERRSVLTLVQPSVWQLCEFGNVKGKKVETLPPFYEVK